jgi:hypothetical protein
MDDVRDMGELATWRWVMVGTTTVPLDQRTVVVSREWRCTEFLLRETNLDQLARSLGQQVLRAMMPQVTDDATRLRVERYINDNE